MGNLFVVFLIGLAASAGAVDWNDYASTVTVLRTPLKVSKIEFKERSLAKQFCDKLEMKLANFATLRKAAANAEPHQKAGLERRRCRQSR